MGWNIGLLCVKAGKEEIDNIIPDVMYKSHQGLFFDDAASVTMDKALGVAFTDTWTLIVDVQGRIIFNDTFPKMLSKKYKVKTFYISEGLVYRDYNFGFFKRVGIHTEYKGVEGGLKYLKEKKIKPIDEWGESMIFQIIEKEIFGIRKETYGTSLMDLEFDKYDFD